MKRRQHFKMSFGKEQLNLTRVVIGHCIIRSDEKIPTSSLSDEILIGIPEATVVTIADGYYFYKIARGIDNDSLIFDILTRARQYDSKEQLELKTLKPNNLIEFIEANLKLHDQSGYLNKKDIETLLDNYRRIKQINE